MRLQCIIFPSWHIKMFLILGIICLPVILFLDLPVISILFMFAFRFLLVFVGQLLYENETTQNWLEFSPFGTMKNEKIFGGVLIFFGWSLFLRGVLAVAIASIFSQLK